MKKINEKRLAKIMAYDICAILDDAENGILDYLLSWLQGDGVRQYNEWTDEDVENEWREGEYDGESKKEQVEGSPVYARFEYVRQLWDQGDTRGLFVSGPGGGKFFGPNTPQFKRS